MERNVLKKILVIRFSSLGDVILTTPLLKILKQKYPESQIDFLVKRQYSEALKNNPNIGKLIEADDNIDLLGLKKLKNQIRSGNYGLIIDAHNNLRTFYLRLFLNSTKHVFKKYSLRKFLLVKFKINLMKDFPAIAERYCQVLGKYSPPLKGGVAEGRGGLVPEIFPDESSKQNVEKLLNELNIDNDKKLICIVPSSKHFTKTYPAEYYAELINKFDSNKYAFVLIGKGNDKINISKIKSITGNNVYDLCDKLSILDIAELMKRCSLVISGDTGPMHIAEAFNIPLIMIAGSSVREFGFYPQNKKSFVIENRSLKCRPCSHIGRSECPLEHFKCMREIKPDVILREAMNLLFY